MQNSATSNQLVKKQSKRMSMASRQSLASLLTHKSSSAKSHSGSSRTIGGFSDSRCYKHSPRVGQHFGHAGLELTGFEAEQWREAFNAMGSLKKRGDKAPKPFTVLNKAPYHCSCLARSFEVRYGEMIKLQPPIFRQAKKVDRPQSCNCITKEALPVHQDPRITGPLRESLDQQPISRLKYYIPKTCVVVRWDPRTHSSVEKICEWLVTSFGAFLFTTRTASNAILVAFETMEQAHRAVQFPLLPTSKITITWNDPHMYNFGHYMMFRNYTVATDTIWKRSMEERTKHRSTRDTQSTFDARAKPKRLKITD